ncbi:hypothetical protein G8770_15235 [Aestuariicella hydrocarbonica]|uniref:Uncharacterized protein n=1 Tax=Pseudomaricurvus hydrocarbonicus TaxID=1470433 RepID=A0A9E5JX42_9GAMM|nr:hypothetical protein [Aestuariicella hydrocarbonica]NHO66904.1 hypothetical protein [Aestuariicella hydrocarbonica]
MDNLIYFFAYIGYIAVSSVVAYPLLKWKSQQPKTLSNIIDMVFFNAIILGALPLLPFLMKYPPKQPISPSESYEYYNKKRIWLWNK